VADGALGTSLNVTVTLSDPVSYVGFAWGTPDPMNEVDVYNGSTLLGSFFGDFAIGASAFTYYFDIHAERRGGYHSACVEQHCRRPVGLLL
jgi:hypothetical protein